MTWFGFGKPDLNFFKLLKGNKGNREIKEGKMCGTPVCFCLAPLSQTYHTHLSSITIIFYNTRYMNNGYS
jgi:hypothetical protein